MPKFAANLSFMFTEIDFLDRFEAAAEAGFKAVEYLFPYDHAPEELRARLLGRKTLPPLLPLLQKLTAGGIEIHTQIVLCPGLNDGVALEKAMKLLTKHGCISDTVARARHYGEIARDALAPLEAGAHKDALLDVVEFCISRVK